MINKVILMGRLTRDPEVRHTSTGKAVCSFSIAIDNGYGETDRQISSTALRGKIKLSFSADISQKV